jgi:hypothetical protein
VPIPGSYQASSPLVISFLLRRILNEKNLPLVKTLNDMSNEYFKHDDSKRASKVKSY